MDSVDRIERSAREHRTKEAAHPADPKRSRAASFTRQLPELRPDAANRYEPFPCTEVQQQYLLGRGTGNGPSRSYFEVDVIGWDAARFESALHKLIQRHEMLRCVFLPGGVQRILQTIPSYHIAIEDLRGGDPQAVTAALSEVRQRLLQQVRPADTAPLFDCRASRVEDDRTRLHITLDWAIADARSFEIVFRELSQLYRDPDAAFQPLDVSYRDYILACDAFETSDTFSQSREYWLKRIATLPVAPELPQSGAVPSESHLPLTRRRARLEADAWRNLKDRAARSGLTPATIVLAAYAEVLAIWSKSPHFTLRLKLFDRFSIHPQARDLAGDFTTVNLLEVDNAKVESFEARARHQQEQLWKDLDHRYFSGVRVMREMTGSQSGAKNIMPVVFTNLLNIGDDNSGSGIWAERLGEVVYAASQEPGVLLDFIIREDYGALILDWDSVDASFPPGLLDGMFTAYRSLLVQLASEDASWNRALSDNTRKLLPAPHAQLYAEVNHTAAPLSEEYLHTLFLKQVQQWPEKIAVRTPTRRLSYREVYDRACRIEGELLQRGLEPNQLVGIVMEKGWEQVVAVLGVLFAGGAYMPIDPELPAERQHYLIENGDVKVVLTQTSLQRVSAPQEVEVLKVDEMLPLENQPIVPRMRQKREDLAYVIYTSGSTGEPKGVMIDHCGAVNTILDINERFAVGPEDSVLALSHLSFDLSVYDIFGLLAAGGTVVMPTAELAQDPRHWAELLLSEKVTIWNTVPALMGLLVDQAENGEPIGQSVRVVLMSGDWIPVSLPGRIRELLPDAKLMSLGGATEASIWSILYPIENQNPSWKSIPYGKPMRNQSFHVLNQVGAPCPVWVPGQLCIGGVGLARGYWRDAHKTHRSFIHHKASGERLYRTGDWGRYLPDGNIEFLGREDLQVKIQGNRIELGEIEAKLAEHEGVENCVVLVREDIPGEKWLAGYVVARAGASLQPSDLREFLRAKLPEYMLPSAFLFVDQFPLTPNGKVNRNALLRAQSADAQPPSARENNPA